MNLSEDEVIEIYAKQCFHLIEIHYYHTNKNGLAFNVATMLFNENINPLKINEKKIKFINRLKNAEHNLICICIDVYEIYESDDYDKIYEVLTSLNNKKLKLTIS